MLAPAAIDPTAGFPGDVLGPVPMGDAVNRVLVFCTAKGSGWSVYDLAGDYARSSGALNEVTAWSLLFANALNGRVEIKQIADFNRIWRRDLAERIGRVPADRDLHCLTDDEIDAVISVCQFGFSGVWAPRTTKLAALYRPMAVPVLDGYVGMAFGYQQDDLSTKVQRFGLSREERIAKIVRALVTYLRDYTAAMAHLRAQVSTTVPELAPSEEPGAPPLISDLRLLDIVLWTSIDDRRAERAGKPLKWLGHTIGAHIPLETVAPEPIRPRAR
ncbi:DUF6308 family protein [Virgisporangium aurantiacum]|uniref:Uncharacterized protein n=1 Tax=Virgisporangium aurantiacum TaxID=175570 RepID=A0A8J4E657_9ACTN|nr:DUF6308 family protein [Virgisporangium aurantiacum]GIJ63071.1 hypothetical protein Vau01_105870 [Virgisporangium aurantiacum]